MEPFQATVDIGREIAEIARDFQKPHEVLRESLHNSYDAGANNVWIVAQAETLASGNRALTLEFSDDGLGMTNAQLRNFFGLGHSTKEPIPNRPPIGFKGHGTKIYYQALDLYVATRRMGGSLLVARLLNARGGSLKKQVPAPELYEGAEAEQLLTEVGMKAPHPQGSSIRLVDFTANSDRLIDQFSWVHVENYLRWFTIFGSFRSVVYPNGQSQPLQLWYQPPGEKLMEVSFGHPWPKEDRVLLKALKAVDERRPFNFFRKTLRGAGLVVSGAHKIDVAVLFEGRRGRLQRDERIRRQGRGNETRLYHEEERYGLWLCKDFVPIEPKFDWLKEEQLTEDAHLLHLLQDNRPLVFVNCQDFSLTANRGSVGNSSDELLAGIKDGVFAFLQKALTDKDVVTFLEESQEDFFERLREKDKKALQKRLDRYRKKERFQVVLTNGVKHEFYEPGREITLFGLLCELQVLDKNLLELNILDYDDHFGIDLLVRRNGNPGDLLEKSKVAYTELKSKLESQLNHAFDNLWALICWECLLTHNDKVTDPTGAQFTYNEEVAADGITYSRLVPPAGSKQTHNVRVIVLKRLLEEKCQMVAVSKATSAGSAPKTSRKK